jgi:hypothetical protein
MARFLLSILIVYDTVALNDPQIGTRISRNADEKCLIAAFAGLPGSRMPLHANTVMLNLGN